VATVGIALGGKTIGGGWWLDPSGPWGVGWCDGLGAGGGWEGPRETGSLPGVGDLIM